MFALALQLIEHESEQEVFSQLYERYLGLSIWVAKSYGLSDSDAEDAVQDAFFALAEHFSKYFSEKRHNWKSLIVTIVKNKAIDLRRQNQRRMGEVFDEAVHGEILDVLPEEFLSESPLVQCILRLPERDQLFLRLRHEQGLSTRETAHLLGLSWEAGRKLEQRIRGRLERLCREEGLL